MIPSRTPFPLELSMVKKVAAKRATTSSESRTLQSLISEFAEDYALQPKGQKHLAAYDTGREEGRRNFEAILAKKPMVKTSPTTCCESFCPTVTPRGTASEASGYVSRRRSPET